MTTTTTTTTMTTTPGTAARALERALPRPFNPAIAGVEKELPSRGRPVCFVPSCLWPRSASRLGTFRAIAPYLGYISFRRRRVPRTARNVLPTALSSIAYRFVSFVYAATLAIVSLPRWMINKFRLRPRLFVQIKYFNSSDGRDDVGCPERKRVARLTEAPMRIRCRQSLSSPR